MQEDEEGTAILNFAQQREIACNDGWLQGRYYDNAGKTVKELLSFASIFEVNPFEVGVNRASQRRKFSQRLRKVRNLLQLDELMDRVFNVLSNGEMRRVLFARAILKGPKKLILDDPMAGLDPERRKQFKHIVTVLASEGVDVRLRCRHADEKPSVASVNSPIHTRKSTRTSPNSTGKPIVEMRNISIKFGKRILFKDFNWTVRRGERWVLCGPNGSGKTTLIALMTGDSPLAYANDVRVFGIPREPGRTLSRIRRRIAAVSPEMQTYLDKGPEELLEEALAREPELLILDEPCLNLGVKESRQLLRRVEQWLKGHPETTAIVIAHRNDHIPRGFKQIKRLGTEN